LQSGFNIFPRDIENLLVSPSQEALKSSALYLKDGKMEGKKIRKKDQMEADRPDVSEGM